MNIEEYKKSKEGKYCRLRLIEQVDTPFLKLRHLMDNGLKSAPQGPIRLKEELLEYINNNFNDFYYEGYFPDNLMEKKLAKG